MDTCFIQNLFSSFDSQKPDRLFIRFGAESFHFFDLGFAGEFSMFVPVSYDIFCNRLAQSRDILQQGIARSIHIHTYAIHDIFYFLLKLFFEIFLIDIMLILADADGFWIDFRQLCERILYSMRDADRSPDGHIQIGIFVLCEFGRRIDRRS